MWNVRVPFEKISHMIDEMRNGKCQTDFQEIVCHMIFDINMDGKYTHNARLITGGHKNDPPESIKY